MNKDEALKLALEALKRTGNIAGFAHEREQAAITAIREALEQPVQERYFCQRCGKRRGGDVNYIHTCTPPDDNALQQIKRFAALVAAAEREACAKVCDRYVDSSSDHEAGTAMNLQDAIRARGQA
jgi:hypothetical protein